MLLDDFLTDILEYDLNAHDFPYERRGQFSVEANYLLRAAPPEVDGVYVFRTSPESDTNGILKPRPAVYVAKAPSPEKAREIHRQLWNLGYAPFLIVLLPNQVRVYNAFDFGPGTVDEPQEIGLLLEEPLDHHALRILLADFASSSIDSGNIWQSSYAQKIDAKRRVDSRLLKNLENLAEALVNDTDIPLSLPIAHALIGKYIYIRFLRDRKILSPEWLSESNINIDDVLGRDATVKGLRQLDEALESRFNGGIFLLDFDQANLDDRQIRLIASVFKGDILTSPTTLQKSIDFKDFEAYDFGYIPIETLSTIYELFLHAQDRGRSVGAFYTPEVLADYVLSEIHSVKPLQRGMQILDPSCGSGVFLVLAYRRLIEYEMVTQNKQNLSPHELKDLLLESIYGVEREPGACNVTELSLILTMLNYVEPPELHKNKDFKFPKLRNSRIFDCDFFDDDSHFWQSNLRFDWVVGNPPWIELNGLRQGEEKFACEWIEKNQATRPVAQGRIVEAFSWRVGDLLKPDGAIALIHHATSLFNTTSQKYRRKFFQQHQVYRITNFANLRNILFEGRATAPAATFIYKAASENIQKAPIIHYGPFSINQVIDIEKKLWVLTINESEIQAVAAKEAESGEATVWKFALWGTYRDKRAIARIKRLFPMALAELCKKKGWPAPTEGVQLRDVTKWPPEKQDELEFRPELIGKPIINTRDLNKRPYYLLSIPQRALVEKVSVSNAYIRKRGGDAGLIVTDEPHIYLAATWNHIAYSEEDFVIPPRQIGLSTGKNKQDGDYLRALSLYLRSSLVTYYIFFQVPQWGIFHVGGKNIILREVRKIPVPDFTIEQVHRLATLHRELVEEEISGIAQVNHLNSSSHLQNKLDEHLFEILSIPNSLRILIREFVETRLPLDQGKKAVQQLKRFPNPDRLLAYGKVLRDKLDDAVVNDTHHKVMIYTSRDLIRCMVEISHSQTPFSVIVKQADQETTEILSEIGRLTGKRESQWVYVQRGLRVFDGPRIHIYKAPHLIEWTRTQALNDAADITAEILAAIGAS